MPLVGTIRTGTLDGLISSLERTGGSACITLNLGEQEAILAYQQGKLSEAELGDKEGDAVLEAVRAWEDGCFSLELETSSATRAQPSAPHIMVLDEELGARKLVERYLSEAGYRVSVLSQARQVKSLMEVAQPALVLMDINLSGTDGFVFAENLRAEDDKLSVVLMSSQPSDAERAKEAGIPFFSKPFDLTDLTERIAELAGRPPTPAEVDAATAEAAASFAKARANSADSDLGADLDATEGGMAYGTGRELGFPGRLADLLDVESFLPPLDACYFVEEVAKARIALATPEPELAAMVAGLDGFTPLREWLDEDPEQRGARLLFALILSSVDGLLPADQEFGTEDISGPAKLPG